MKKIPEFENKTVLVTGGASGMGRGIVALFAEHGAIVYAADINKEGLQSLAKTSERITPVKLDVTQQQDFQQVIDQVVAEHVRLDFIVNNAGMALAGDFNNTSIADIEKSPTLTAGVLSRCQSLCCITGHGQVGLWDTAVNVKGYDIRENMESTGMKPISSREAAEAIFKGIKANDRTIIFPKFVQFVLFMYRWFPSPDYKGSD